MLFIKNSEGTCIKYVISMAADNISKSNRTYIE